MELSFAREWDRLRRATRGSFMTASYRSGLLLICLAVWCTLASAQDQVTSAQTTTVVSSSTPTTHLRVADPNDTIVVAGRIMRVSDLLALFSPVDSLGAPNPRTPEKQNHGKPPLNGLPPKAAPAPCSDPQQQGPSCVATGPEHQGPVSKPQPE
jgi:hypothetical protein